MTIEDRHSQVLAYSGSQQAGDPARLETILGRRVPERLRGLLQQQGVFARLAATDEPVFVARRCRSTACAGGWRWRCGPGASCWGRSG